MSVMLSNLTFDRVRYDAGGDVLYLHGAGPTAPSSSTSRRRDTTCASTRRLIGVTIVRPRWLLEHEGAITITLPERIEIGPGALGAALTPA